MPWNNRFSMIKNELARRARLSTGNVSMKRNVYRRFLSEHATWRERNHHFQSENLLWSTFLAQI